MVQVGKKPITLELILSTFDSKLAETQSVSAKNKGTNRESIIQIFKETLEQVEYFRSDRINPDYLQSLNTDQLQEDKKTLHALKDKIDTLYKNNVDTKRQATASQKQLQSSFLTLDKLIFDIEALEDEFLAQKLYSEAVNAHFPVKFSDFTIKCKDDTQFPVHLSALLARSPLISRQLEAGAIFPKGEMQLPDKFNPKTVAMALYYLHTGKLDRVYDFSRNEEELIEVLMYFTAEIHLKKIDDLDFVDLEIEKNTDEKSIIYQIKKTPKKEWHKIDIPLTEPNPAIHNELLRWKSFDATIFCEKDDKTLQVHKAFLSKLKSISLDGTTLHIKGISSKAFEKVLHYLYDGVLNLSPSEYKEIAEFLPDFQIILKEELEHFNEEAKRYRHELKKQFPLNYIDFTIKCRNGISLPAHPVVLAGRSSFFSNLLSGRWEKQKHSIDLPAEFNPNDVTIALYYLHTGNLGPYAKEKIDPTTLIPVLEYFGADKEMIDLIKNTNHLERQTIYSPIQRPHPALHNPQTRKGMSDIKFRFKSEGGVVDAHQRKLKSLYAHKAYLSAFKKIPPGADEFILDKISPKSFEKLLGYLYEGTFKDLQATDYREIHGALPQLCDPDLQVKIEEMMKKALADSISVSTMDVNDRTIIDILTLSRDLKLDIVEEKCKTYISDRLFDTKTPLPKWMNEELEIDLSNVPRKDDINDAAKKRVKDAVVERLQEAMTRCPGLMGLNLEDSLITNGQLMQILERVQIPENITINLAKTSIANDILIKLASGTCQEEDFQQISDTIFNISDIGLWLLLKKYQKNDLVASSLAQTPQTLLTDKGLEILAANPPKVPFGLNLNGNKNITAAGLAKFLEQAGANLNELHLLDCSKEIYHYSGLDPNFQRITNPTPSVAAQAKSPVPWIKLDACVNLRTLEITANKNWPYYYLDTTIKKMTKLENLTIKDFKNLDIPSVIDWMKGNPKIKALKLPGSQTLDDAHVLAFIKARNQNPIQELHLLDRAFNLSKHIERFLTIPQPNLKKDDLQLIAKTWPWITKLNLAGNLHITPQDLKAVQNLKLVELNLSGCKQFDKMAINDLPNQFPSLKELVLDDTPALDDELLFNLSKKIDRVSSKTPNQITPLMGYIYRQLKAGQEPNWEELRKHCKDGALSRYAFEWLKNSLLPSELKQLALLPYPVPGQYNFNSITLKYFDDITLSEFSKIIHPNDLALKNCSNLSPNKLKDILFKELEVIRADESVPIEVLKNIVKNNKEVSFVTIRGDTFTDKDLDDFIPIYTDPNRKYPIDIGHFDINSDKLSQEAILKFMVACPKITIFVSSSGTFHRTEQGVIEKS